MIDIASLIFAIHEALPQATASASGNGGLVFSAKHADVIREILAQNAPAAPAPYMGVGGAAHAVSAYREMTQDDMFGGEPRTESELGAIDAYPRVIDTAHEQDPRFNPKRALQDLEDHYDAWAKEDGRRGHLADYVDDNVVPPALIEAAENNPAFVGIMRERLNPISAISEHGIGLIRELAGLGTEALDHVAGKLGMKRFGGHPSTEGDMTLAHRIVTGHAREAIQRAMVAASTSATEHPGLTSVPHAKPERFTDEPRRRRTSCDRRGEC